MLKCKQDTYTIGTLQYADTGCWLTVCVLTGRTDASIKMYTLIKKQSKPTFNIINTTVYIQSDNDHIQSC